MPGTRTTSCTRARTKGWFLKTVDITSERSLLDQLNGICVSTAKLINWASKLTRERELAKQLIAGRAHNFWPATRFYEARWEDRVQAWLANLPTGEPDHSLKS